ncbi:MAG: hypothetical protein N3G76_02805 [Candidatus Micrarchaeota archaeon]|nr:hypothetical protein [Candidatus Micrarchaeota archaeon]
MDIVYSFPNTEKAKAMAIVEGDKFGPLAFATRGFVQKDGTDYGLAGKTLLVIRNVSEEFKKQADVKLKDVAGLEVLPQDKASEIVRRVNEEEEAAQNGFGSIFG